MLCLNHQADRKTILDSKINYLSTSIQHIYINLHGTLAIGKSKYPLLGQPKLIFCLAYH